MELITHPEVIKKINMYPKHVKKPLNELRKLILQTASEIQGATTLEETLKWGEPSYLTKHGSTLRIDWKAKNPEKYAMYFQCTSSLVPTFKIIYRDVFEFEGKRAILLTIGEKIPKKELKHCIKMALTYHKIKQLPLLGN